MHLKSFNLQIQIITLLLFWVVIFTSCKKDKITEVDSQRSAALQNSLEWELASTPLHQVTPGMFPESESGSGLGYRKNAGKLAWYSIDFFYYSDDGSSILPTPYSPEQLSDHYVRIVKTKEVFPLYQEPNNITTAIFVLNLAFYPGERGPYNFDAFPTAYSKGISANGTLTDPSSRWGGIMRRLHVPSDQYNPMIDDYKMESIEFILMDPFIYNPGHSGGDLYINIGDLSEDVLRDGRLSAENGLPGSHNITGVDTTIWGRVALNLPSVFAFSSDIEARPFQDVGFDGLRDEDERTFFGDSYISVIENLYGIESGAYKQAVADPSADNFVHHFDPMYNHPQVPISERYLSYNGVHGNSNSSNSSNIQLISTTLPDSEDFNRSSTLETDEKYFQYKISLRPSDMKAGSNYIVSIAQADVLLPNNKTETVNWYTFRIPINSAERQAFGGITDGDYYNMIRIFFKNFNEPVICRFAEISCNRTLK